MTSSIKSRLTQIKTPQTNAYQHIKKLLINMVLDQKNLSSFEQYSYLTRQPHKQQVVFKVRQSYSHMKQYQSTNRILLNKINTGTPQQPQQPTSLTYIPDLMEQCQVFSRIGVGFGQDQIYRIYKSLCVLSIKKNTKQLKLWGKILTVEKDYYVAEGLADGGEDVGELAPETEAKGTGINKWSYWVTTMLTGEWTQLPLITPVQLQISRKIQYMFSGDLKKNILTNPMFNGTQAHLLKCQIVRITSSCSIIPKGIYITNADDPKQIQLAQTPIFPQLPQLVDKQNWVYLNQAILKNGRISHFKPQNLEQQQAQKQLKKMMDADPLQPRLKIVAMDAQHWMVKAVGLDQSYKSLAKIPKILSTGVVGLRSLIWPGWTTVGWQGKYASLYVGYGFKHKFNYFPREPEPIIKEGPDREETVIKE